MTYLLDPFKLSIAYRSAVLADSPLAYWPLDDLSGTTATDVSGNGRDGTYSGGYTLGSPLVNDEKSVLIGTNGVVTIPGASWMDLATFSIECWFRTTSHGPLVSRDSASRRPWVTGIEPTTGYQVYAYGNNQYGPAKYSLQTNLHDGEWHHLVWTITGAVGKHYLDGVETLSYSNGGTIPPSSSIDLLIGRTYNVDDSFVGSIARVAMYGSVLSGARVLAHYQAGRDVLLLGYDSFNKATSNSTLGAMNVGTGWTAHNGSVWGIDSAGSAYVVSATVNQVSSVSFDVGTADMDISWVYNTHDRGYANPAIRMDSSGLGLFIGDGVSTAPMNLFKQIDPVTNALIYSMGSIGPMIVGDVYRAKCVGSTIYFYRNGALLVTCTGVTDHQTDTRAGMQQYVTTGGHINAARWGMITARAS